MNKRILLCALLALCGPMEIYAKKGVDLSQAAQSILALVDDVSEQLKESGLIFDDISDTELTTQLSKLPKDVLAKVRGNRSEKEFNELFTKTAHHVAKMLDAAIAKRRDAKPITRSITRSGGFGWVENLSCWVKDHKILFVVLVVLIVVNLQQK
jgi:hypothetical protein